MATSGLFAAASHLAPRLRGGSLKLMRCFPPPPNNANNNAKTSSDDDGTNNATIITFVPHVNLHDDPAFAGVLADAAGIAASEPALKAGIHRDILRHTTLEKALSSILADKLCGCAGHAARDWKAVFDEVYSADFPRRHHHHRDGDGDGASAPTPTPTPGELARLDLAAVCDRDPACLGPAHALLFLKGYQALQAHRLAHALWMAGRRSMALAMALKVSEKMGVDVHPAARLGGGLLIDHATGIVIGETCVVGEDCTLLQGVTLGSSGWGGAIKLRLVDPMSLKGVRFQIVK